MTHLPPPAELDIIRRLLESGRYPTVTISLDLARRLIRLESKRPKPDELREAMIKQIRETCTCGRQELIDRGHNSDCPGRVLMAAMRHIRALEHDVSSAQNALICDDVDAAKAILGASS